MAKFTMEETMAAAAVTNLLNGWAQDLDMNHGANIGNFVTEDVSYILAGVEKKGRAAVQANYAERHKNLTADGKSMPTARHVNANYCFKFKSADEVDVTFGLIFFTTQVPGLNPADVVAVADVWMTCRRSKDGEWLIAKFDSNQPLKRVG
jgi:hypothetical protein